MIKYAKLLLNGCLTMAFLLGCSSGKAQTIKTISIDTCYQLARQNYPLIRQVFLIEKSRSFSLENASKGYLPRIGIAGQASYQSDVIQIPLELPAGAIPTIEKDQYKLYGEIVQPVTDLFTVDQERKMVEARAEVEEQRIEVELFKLKERLNQLYFGILLMDAQRKQLEFLTEDIQAGLDKVNAALANGTAMQRGIHLLQAELLKVKQQGTALKASRAAYTDMLSLFINRKVGEETRFEKPALLSLSPDISRPELFLYDRQMKTTDIQNRLLGSKIRPRISLFFQGGYGRPALNLLNNAFDLYYITGLRANWNIASFYTQKNEKQILALDKRRLEIQREAFLFNTHILMKQQEHEINKLLELIETDKEIIQLRESIKNTSKTQLEAGVIDINDFLKYLNEENRAKQDLVLHQIQLMMAQYHYKTTSGN